METFFTILAWAFLVFSTLRIIGVFIGAREHAALIRVAEAMGATPVHDALKTPVIVFIVCICWLIST